MNRNDAHDAVYEVFGSMQVRYEIRDAEIFMDSLVYAWNTSIPYDAGSNYGQKRSALQQGLNDLKQGVNNSSVAFRPEWPLLHHYPGVGLDNDPRELPTVPTGNGQGNSPTIREGR